MQDKEADSPVTKKDLNDIRIGLSDLKEVVLQMFDSQDKRMEQFFTLQDERIEKQIAEQEERSHQRMLVLVEELNHNFEGIFNDRTLQHSDKLVEHSQEIRAIKSHVGLLT